MREGVARERLVDGCERRYVEGKSESGDWGRRMGRGCREEVLVQQR